MQIQIETDVVLEMETGNGRRPTQIVIALERRGRLLNLLQRDMHQALVVSKRF
jgi:hypothetical protein